MQREHRILISLLHHRSVVLATLPQGAISTAVSYNSVHSQRVLGTGNLYARKEAPLAGKVYVQAPRNHGYCKNRGLAQCYWP
jgi:hypothetical protein